MELELKDYLRIIQKRLWMIVIVLLIACISTGVISYFVLQPTFSASTKLVVNKSNTKGLDPTAQQMNINDLNFNIRLIDTYKEIIKTTKIMELVVRDHPEFELTSQQLISKIKVSSVNNTQVMTLSVEDLSYMKAASIVNAVSETFQREIVNIFSVDNVSILQKADIKAQPAPIKPNPELNIAISLVISLMIAFGIAFLLEYLDDTIKSEADVAQYLGLPTLTTVTRVRPEDTPQQSTTPIPKTVGETKHV